MVKVGDDVKGNAESNNLAQKINANKFKYASQKNTGEQAAAMAAAEANAANVDAEIEGSLDEADAEERRAAIAASEANQSGSYYNEQINEIKSKGSDLRKSWSRNIKSTGLVTTLITAAGTFILTLAGGGSLATALEKGLTNENANDTRTNLVMRRAFNSMIGSNAPCTKFNLGCRMKTATKEQIKKWKDGKFSTKGQILDKDGKPRGGEVVIDDPDKQMQDGDRVKITSETASDGSLLKSGADVNAAADARPSIRTRLATSFNLRTNDFIHGKFAQLLSKFGLNKGSPTAEEKQRSNATEDKAKAAVEDKLADDDPTKAKNALKTAVKSAGAGATAAQIACLAYNVTRVSVGAVKAAWVIDITRVMWPYMRLISKIADGSATDADFKEIETKFMALIDYISPTKSADLQQKIANNSLSDDEKTLLKNFGIDADDLTDQGDRNDAIKQLKEITNKNALDSQGMMMALYNDNTGLMDFTNKFSTSIIGGGTVLVDTFLDKAREFASFGGGGQKEGKRNIRTACIGANTVAAGLATASMAACFVPGVGTVACLGKFIITGGVWIGAFLIAQQIALAVAPLIIAKGVQSVDFSADLRGPALGNALAAALGLLLTRKSQSSALRPALSMAAVDGFVASTDKYYNQYGDQLAQYDARETPFDTGNKYSFMGQIFNSLNPYPNQPGQQKTVFSYVANLLGIVPTSLVKPASALHSQPALLTESANTLRARTNNGVCPDFEKQDEYMVCDWNGQAISISSPRVLQWAEEDSSGKTDHLQEVIDWMQKPQPNDEGREASSGTADQTCSDITTITSLDFSSLGACDKTKNTPSIDEQGKAVAGSQYEQYVKYCTDQRELEMGSTDTNTDIGSIKEQAWHSGGQCGMTYDTNGKSSVIDVGNSNPSNDFNPDNDTAQTSYMMDAFAYYYNMCYVQYAVANNATDCTNDTPPDGGAAASSTAGNGNIAETAKEMGQWGGTYQSCYTYGGGHGDTEDLKRRIDNHFAGPENGVDCSGFVRAVIYQATGKDPGAFATDAMCADSSKFEKIPRNSAQPGDFAIDCSSHVEVITAANAGTFQTVGSHTTGCGPGYGASPGNYQGSGNFVLRYKG